MTAIWSRKGIDKEDRNGGTQERKAGILTELTELTELGTRESEGGFNQELRKSQTENCEFEERGQMLASMEQTPLRLDGFPSPPRTRCPTGDARPHLSLSPGRGETNAALVAGIAALMAVFFRLNKPLSSALSPLGRGARETDGEF
jgi:hypothetical protein